MTITGEEEEKKKMKKNYSYGNGATFPVEKTFIHGL